MPPSRCWWRLHQRPATVGALTRAAVAMATRPVAMVGGATMAAMEATTAVVARAVEREPATAEEVEEEAMAAASVGVATVGVATGRAA